MMASKIKAVETRAKVRQVKVGTKFKPELAATVLVEAAYTSDEKAAEKYGVSQRSIPNWRARLDSDPEFASIFHVKRERFEASWADDLPAAIRACIDFIKRAALEANPTKPDVIYSVAGALKIVSDIQMSKDIIDARLTDFNRQTREADNEMVAEARQDNIAVETVVDSSRVKDAA